ncbi:type ISP restriction/modification enzyme, partial [Thiospirillum jenense]
RQNERRISVIIGNPPYNANQMNENDNNKNREYKDVDTRIRATYIAASTAQKTKLYDMYARFFRWASDRLKVDGIIAFVSNNSFIDSRTFDGFRKLIAQEFSEIRIINLKGNARTSGKRRRQEGGNIFRDQIRVGIAIWFCVKRQENDIKNAQILYTEVKDYATADEKLAWIDCLPLDKQQFEYIRPDEKNNWLNQPTEDWDHLLPVANKETKAAKTAASERAIFKLYSLGVVTARDEWMYDVNQQSLENKVRFLIDVYNADRFVLAAQSAKQDTSHLLNYQIKWTRAVKAALGKNISIDYNPAKITVANYRPFMRCFLYRDKLLNEMGNQTPRLFGYPCQFINASITVMGDSTGKPYFTLAIDRIPDLNFVSPASGGSQTFPLHVFNESGDCSDNITDWALEQFTAHYQTELTSPARALDKPAIFHYCYAVLHDPIYRDKYALNLKRDFPRIPFYSEFWRWVDWGAALLDLHLNYEQTTPFPFTRIDTPDDRARAAGVNPKVLLRADVNNGSIRIDSETTLFDIPATAWTYQLGNRCAIEWILDQYKEKTPKDPTIRARFNTYRFADYKESVINLIARVTTVSIETMQIVNAMYKLNRTSTESYTL